MTFRLVLGRDPVRSTTSARSWATSSTPPFLLLGAILLNPPPRRPELELVLYTVLSLTLVRCSRSRSRCWKRSRGRRRSPSWAGSAARLASIVFAVIVVGESNLPHENLIVLTIYLTVGLSVLRHRLTAAPSPPATPTAYQQIRGKQAPPMESGAAEVTRTRGPIADPPRRREVVLLALAPALLGVNLAVLFAFTRRHDDARGVPARRQAGRRPDDPRVRGRLCNPHARLKRTEMASETEARTESFDKWVARATTPRGAAVVIATVSAATTLGSGLLMRGPRPRALRDARTGALVADPDGHDGRVRRQRADDGRGWTPRRCRNDHRDRLPDGDHRRNHEHVRRAFPARGDGRPTQRPGAARPVGRAARTNRGRAHKVLDALVAEDRASTPCLPTSVIRTPGRTSSRLVPTGPVHADPNEEHSDPRIQTQ